LPARTIENIPPLPPAGNGSALAAFGTIFPARTFATKAGFACSKDIHAADCGVNVKGEFIMGLLLLIIILFLLFGGGGYYGYRRQYYGGGGFGLIGIILIVLVVLAFFGHSHWNYY
jgi:hypothetical protein